MRKPPSPHSGPSKSPDGSADSIHAVVVSQVASEAAVAFGRHSIATSDTHRVELKVSERLLT